MEKNVEVTNKVLNYMLDFYLFPLRAASLVIVSYMLKEKCHA